MFKRDKQVHTKDINIRLSDKDEIAVSWTDTETNIRFTVWAKVTCIKTFEQFKEKRVRLT